jgi:hypothetical protein
MGPGLRTRRPSGWGRTYRVAHCPAHSLFFLHTDFEHPFAFLPVDLTPVASAHYKLLFPRFTVGFGLEKGNLLNTLQEPFRGQGRKIADHSLVGVDVVNGLV